MNGLAQCVDERILNLQAGRSSAAMAEDAFLRPLHETER